VPGGRAWLAACWAIVIAVALAAPPASGDRTFKKRFSDNKSGDIVMAANTLLSCLEGATGCADARDGQPKAKLGNNQWNMRYVDVDNDATTDNSSSADIILPADASILFAGLYWGANTSKGGAAPRGEPEAKDAPKPGDKNKVRFDTPDPETGYVDVPADQVDTGSAGSQPNAYQGFANVTKLVEMGGAGTYTTANVQTGQGKDRYAGWALVVAYHSPTATSRNLTIFDGFESVNDGDAPHEFAVSGFQTPSSPPVRSKLGFVAYEGDRSLGGDKGVLNTTESRDNLFDSRIYKPFPGAPRPGSIGEPVTTKDPDYDNQLGFDAQFLNTTGVLPPGAESAAIKLVTTGDTYLPGVGWFVTDLFSPDVQSSKSVTDLNGGLVEPGDELEYVISGTNRGKDAALNAVVTDPVPANTTFVGGSLITSSGRIGLELSDGAGDDQAEFDSGAGQVVFRVGEGASATAGGRLPPGAGYEVLYRVRVAGGTPSGTVITNRARVSFLAETLKFADEKTTNETRLTTVAPDLAMNKSFGILAPGTYGFTVTNVGDAPTRGPVVLTDTPPAGIVTVVNSGGFTCTGGTSLRCERSDSLAPGQSWVVTAQISVALVSNTAMVDGGGDVNGSNNRDTIFRAQPSLAVEKQVTPDTVSPGDEVTYLLTVGNRSSATVAESVQLTDPLPPGLTLVSAEALDQGTCDATVTCSLGTIPAFGSARVRIRARVGAQVAPGAVTNTATVSGPLDDPIQEDNTDTGTFDVRRTASLEASKRLEGTARAGRPVRWTVTVQNAGPHASIGADFVDVLPEVVENASATVAGGSCQVAERTLSCALPEIAAAGRAEISVTGTLRSNAAARQLLNGVQLQPDEFQPSRPLPPFVPSFGPIGPLPPPPATGAATPPGEVVRPAADVGVAKVATPDPLARNGRATWHIRTTNHGPSIASNVRIRDTLPAGARYLRSTGAGRCTVRRRVVTCRLPRLRDGRSVETGIVARLRAGRNAGTLRNSIVADAAQADPAAANNRDRASSALAPRLTVRKAVNARSAERGDALTYTLRLRNGGPGTVRNVVLCDRPGRGLMLRRAPGGRIRRGAACWTIRRLARGGSLRRRAVAVVMSDSSRRLRNVATVRFDGVRVARTSRAVRVMRGLPPGVTG
jgi:uncharacterized repeat protein (TIGR01451 family)